MLLSGISISLSVSLSTSLFYNYFCCNVIIGRQDDITVVIQFEYRRFCINKRICLYQHCSCKYLFYRNIVSHKQYKITNKRQNKLCLINV